MLFRYFVGSKQFSQTLVYLPCCLLVVNFDTVMFYKWERTKVYYMRLPYDKATLGMLKKTSYFGSKKNMAICNHIIRLSL
jgi:tRNA(His) 5'-end guanylyltransferase